MWCNLRFNYGKSCNEANYQKILTLFPIDEYITNSNSCKPGDQTLGNCIFWISKKSFKSTCGLRSLVLHQPLILYWYVTKAKEEEKRSRAFHVHNNRNVLLNQIYYTMTMSGIMIHALLAFLGNHSCKVFMI